MTRKDRERARFTASEGRKFAWTVGGAFLALAGLSLWRTHMLRAAVIGGLGVTLAILGVVVPARLGPLYRAWMSMARAISRVTTPIVMSVLYMVVLTPLAVVMRLFGWNALGRPSAAVSHWDRREQGRSDLERQF